MISCLIEKIKLSIKFFIVESIYFQTSDFFRMIFYYCFKESETKSDKGLILVFLDNEIKKYFNNEKTKVKYNESMKIEIEEKKYKKILGCDDKNLKSKEIKERTDYKILESLITTDYFKNKEENQQSLIYIYEYFLMFFPEYYKNHLITKDVLFNKNEYIINSSEKIYLAIMVSNIN